MEKPIILVDGSSYLYRAFHALPALNNSKGEPTGAIYGVTNMIRKLITDHAPTHVAIIFDPKGKTFRDDLYPDYKAHRPPMPDELRDQIQPLFELIEAMGLPLLIVDGVEADDVIGTLATEASKTGKSVLISSGDKDMAQLVNKNITLMNTMNNTLLDTSGVKEKFGVTPKQMIDYLTLTGDTSDNIPGVPNVGPKTAAKWLQQYGSLDEIVKHTNDIRGKVGENLRASLEQLPLCKKLVTIKLDVPLKLSLAQLTLQKPDQHHLIELLKRLEFKSWLVEALNNIPDNNTSTDYHTILEEKEFDVWLAKLQKANAFAFDTETNSLNTIEAALVGISFAIESAQAAYVPLAHDYERAPQQLNRDIVLKKLKPLLENPKKIKIGQNLKYDTNVLANYNVNIQGIGFDTMLESYILNSSDNRHDLASLALKYLGKNTIHFEDVAGKGAKQITFNQVAVDTASKYAAEDADIALQLHEKLWPKICTEKGLKYTFEKIEMPLVPVLARMERTGVCVDSIILNKHSEELAKRLVILEEKAYKFANQTFNMNSPKQLQEILYTQLKLPVLKKTPTGQPSTEEFILQELALDYPLPELILEYRSLSKLKSTYTDALPRQINPKTGRVHTSYNQAVTSTGRLSSTDPNLQNIPVRTEEGRRIRQAFTSPQGYKIISADYSQIELRIMAYLSQDTGLLTAFKNGLDIHRATASEVWGIPLDKVTSEQRRHAKAINFGLIYGMSAFGLSKQIGVDRAHAQEYMDIYFTRYPGVKKYMEKTRKQAGEQGYVETLCGRRLYVKDIKSSDFQRRHAAERAAINAPLQGTAADIIKLAMIKLDAWLQTSTIDAKMIMQVHDELVFEVAKKDVDTCTKHIKQFMEKVDILPIPIHVDVGVGNNWDEAH